MASATFSSRPLSIPMLPLALVALAILVVSIKFVSPINYYVSEHLAQKPLPDVPVMWDFWWPFYLMIAAGLYTGARRARALFVALAGVRVLWSIICLTLFFARPDWNFWRLQWGFCELVALLILGWGLLITLTALAREDAALRSRVAI